MTNSTLARRAHVAGSYASWFLLLGLALGLIYEGAWYFTAYVLLMILAPALDAVCGPDRNSFSAKHYSRFETFLLDLSPVGLVLGYSVIAVVYAARAAQLSSIEWLLSVLSVGAVGVVAISGSHELGHQRSRAGKWLAMLGLLMTGYQHFSHYHPFHHKHRGTSIDNHTAGYGEGFYSYLRRTLAHTLPTCWRTERARLSAKGRRLYSWENRLLRMLVAQFAAYSLFYFTLGVHALLFFVLQGLVSALSLEVISYIQHYGLVRNSAGASGHDAQATNDSWDCYQRFSSYLVYMVTRHSDHHHSPAKRFYLLEANRRSFVLPVGYQMLILLVLIPPFWRRFIHPMIARENSIVNMRSTSPA